MEVKLRLSGFLSAPSSLGEKGIDVELPPDSTLHDLLELCLQKFGAGIIGGSKEYQRRYLFEHMLVILNSGIVHTQDASKAELHDGDIVTLVPPVSGGKGEEQP